MFQNGYQTRADRRKLPSTQAADVIIGWKIALGVVVLGAVIMGIFEWVVGGEILGLLYDTVRAIFPVFPEQ